MICVSGQSKSRPVKAAGAESCGQSRNKKLHAAVAKSAFWSENVQNTSGSKHFLKFGCRKNYTPLWRKAHFEVKMYKRRQVWAAFWSSDVEKMHSAVAKSAFSSENGPDTSFSEALFEVLMSKNARRCGEKHIWNVQNTSVSERFSEVWCAKLARRCGEKHAH